MTACRITPLLQAADNIYTILTILNSDDKYQYDIQTSTHQLYLYLVDIYSTLRVLCSSVECSSVLPIVRAISSVAVAVAR